MYIDDIWKINCEPCHNYIGTVEIGTICQNKRNYSYYAYPNFINTRLGPYNKKHHAHRALKNLYYDNISNNQR